MTVSNNQYVKLFANVIPVKGAKQAILCDTHRGDYRVIPKDLYELLMKYDGCSFQEIISAYGEENKTTINEYFNALYQEECIFFCDTQEEVDCFPQMNRTFDFPSIISNAIIDIDQNSNHNYEYIIDQLNKVRCGNLEIRIFEQLSKKVYENIFTSLKKSIIEYCVLICPYNSQLKLKDYEKIIEENSRIAKIIVHSCGEDSVNEIKKVENSLPIFYTNQIIEDASCCGNISRNYFNLDLRFFTEALKFNTCLNQKISIDRNGHLKNCPAMKTSYGQLGERRVEEVVEKKEFQRYWHINKDQIEVCQDCEFRYICQDCRAILKDDNNIYSKPLKCSYNPYEAKWEDVAE